MSDELSKETINDIRRAGQAFLKSFKDYEDAEGFNEIILSAKMVTCPHGHRAFMKLSISLSLMTKQIKCFECPHSYGAEII